MSEEKVESTFDVLSKIDVSDFIEKKGKFNYLPWSDAWAILKTNYPDASSEDHEFVDEAGLTVPYMETKAGCFVKVTVTVEGQDETETYPVLDYNNKTIAEPNAFDINTSLKRCLVKAIAKHGLGLYIYAGEDLPQENIVKPVKVSELVATITELATPERIEAFIKKEGKGSLRDVQVRKLQTIVTKLLSEKNG